MFVVALLMLLLEYCCVLCDVFVTDAEDDEEDVDDEAPDDEFALLW